MSRRVLWSVVLVLEIDPRGNQAQISSCKSRKPLGSQKDVMVSPAGGVGGADGAQALLNAAALHISLDIVRQRDDVPLNCIDFKIFQHNIAPFQSSTMSLTLMPAPWSAKAQLSLHPLP